MENSLEFNSRLFTPANSLVSQRDSSFEARSLLSSRSVSEDRTSMAGGRLERVPELDQEDSDRISAPGTNPTTSGTQNWKNLRAVMTCYHSLRKIKRCDRMDFNFLNPGLCINSREAGLCFRV